MIVKTKCYFLKKDVNPEILTKYGFETFNDGESYWLKEIPSYFGIAYYNDTRRFVDYFRRSGRIKYTKPFIEDLIKDGLVEKGYYYMWYAIIGRWQNYSQSKLERIYKRVERLNKKD